ncbi:DUF4292 domain-containing protein [Pedobacter sp. MC2016-14]|uniref:DUF4292 domain-containing protein n=1 Tax=Pedobacter sp. MC2016-14 TaxID=2897327 RepID=UPI001E579EF1|nr:DUF4292 domain-containing protein [Pedobacter sp. MC2016-14]MCD0487839.1 DUF4292 domain-containing protein [Pedobacter sp. MC2016-14]
MILRNIKYLGIAGLMMMAFACKTRKAVTVTVTPPPPPKTTTVNDAEKAKAQTLKFIKDRDIAFSTLSIKGKASLDMNGEVNNVSVNIRVKRDQIIWVSITAFAGLEPARAMITPDSIFVLNKLQGTYLAKPFSYIQRFSNRQINFKMLQSILTGNSVAEFIQEPVTLKDNGVVTLEGKRADLGFRMLMTDVFKVAELTMNDAKSGQALKVIYGDYVNVDTAIFPAVVKISAMAGTKRTGIDFSFSKIERNVTLDFPFTVPNRYQRID